eukprot:365651-Chlamydomonas_euryale.AAC.3
MPTASHHYYCCAACGLNRAASVQLHMRLLCGASLGPMVDPCGHVEWPSPVQRTTSAGQLPSSCTCAYFVVPPLVRWWIHASASSSPVPVNAQHACST